MARSTRAPLIEATGGLERVDPGRPVAALDGGPGAGHSALVADIRIASHDEAKALLQGTGLSGAADSGGGRATIAALLDRLPTPPPSSADRALRTPGVGEADLDCVLFTESVGVRRLLGVGDVHKAGESAGRESAMGLDLPVHCLVAAPPAALPTRVRRTLPPATGPGREEPGLQLGALLKTTIKSYDQWWLVPAGTALLMVVLGLMAGARLTARRRRATNKVSNKASNSRRL